FGEGVERVFPLYGPNIWEIEVVRKGIVRRAKLYYLRDLRGKASRIAEDTEAQRELVAEQAEEAAKRPRREKLKKEKPKDEKNVRAAKGGGKKEAHHGVPQEVGHAAATASSAADTVREELGRPRRQSPGR